MCQEAHDVTIDSASLWLAPTYCLRCGHDFNRSPALRFVPYCRNCGCPTALYRMMNGGFTQQYQRHHDGRTLEDDRKRFCATDQHSIFAHTGESGHRLSYCPLCGRNLDKK